MGSGSMDASGRRGRVLGLPRVDGVPVATTFLVTAVVTVLIIRGYLSATGYPQLGGNGLHIAHVLWGGMLMLLGVLLLVLRLGRPALRAGAFVAGVGFGFFIDEIGKFVTSDVNYFFEPAVSMIYVVFVVIAIILAVLRHRVRVDQRTALANAMALYDSAVGDPAAGDVRRRVLALLAQADQSDPLVPVMRRAVEQVEEGPSRPPTTMQRWRLAIQAAYDRVSATRWFAPVLVVVFALIAIDTITLSIVVLVDPSPLDVPELLQVTGSLAAGVLIAIGFVALRRSRLAAYVWFERGILVDVLVTQVFAFYNAPAAGVVSLAVDIVLLIALRAAIQHESSRTPAG